MTLRLALRVDGSSTIGLGHVMRCGSLANALVTAGATPVWLTATPHHLPADLDPAIEIVALDSDDGLDNRLLAARIHFLVADWKVTDAKRVAGLRERGLHVTLIGNFLHGGIPDLHVRQGFLPGLSESGAPALSGPKYLLLSKNYANLPAREANEKVKQILLSFGGTHTPLLARIRELLARAFPAIEIDCRGPATNGPVPPMSQALQTADIGILAGGTSLHEAAATGLPTVCVPIAPNQLDRAAQFESAGLGVSLNPADPGFEHQFEADLAALITDVDRRQAMARTGQALVDGRGADRVARHLLGLAAKIRTQSQ